MPFGDLPRNHYRALLVDPPWRFRTWDKREAIPRVRSKNGTNTSNAIHYETMSLDEIIALPVGDLAAPDCSLFLWTSWPMLPDALTVIPWWGFTYKTCAFDWMKAHAGQIDMFRDDLPALMGMGYWTRANSEACLLATRGKPRRKSAGVRMGIIEPRREHSRKPDCVRERIEQLVDGPYLELFARQSNRRGWDFWGNEAEKFNTPPAVRVAALPVRRPLVV
jgi:N6-adenosine-specific RNA methylase IME4